MHSEVSKSSSSVTYMNCRAEWLHFVETETYGVFKDLMIGFGMHARMRADGMSRKAGTV